MQTFPEFLRDRVGPMWVVAPRLTKRLRAKGYEVALPEPRYSTLRTEWETQTYGAPLASIREAGPAMLAALQAVMRCARGEIERPVTQRQPWGEAQRLVESAIARATATTPPLA